MLQHVATLRNRVAKQAQDAATNIVTICCVEMCLVFCRGFVFVIMNITCIRRLSPQYERQSKQNDMIIAFFFGTNKNKDNATVALTSCNT